MPIFLWSDDAKKLIKNLALCDPLPTRTWPFVTPYPPLTRGEASTQVSSNDQH